MNRLVYYHLKKYICVHMLTFFNPRVAYDFYTRMTLQIGERNNANEISREPVDKFLFGQW